MTDNTKVHLTKEGHQKMLQELAKLRAARSGITDAIAEARAHGDLSENAEYHAAKDQQGLNEAMIADLENKLRNAFVVDLTKINTEKVVFGVLVTLLNLQSQEEVQYRIVSEYEANVESGKISVSSPLARAALGKKVGDTLLVRLPKGTREYEILRISV